MISGTVAATREAAYHGVKAMAFSQYVKRGWEVDWDRVTQWVRELALERIAEPLEPGFFWNTNLPHLPPGLVERPETIKGVPGRSPLPVEFARSGEGGDDHVTEYLYAGSYADRSQDPGSDVEICFGGKISVSLVSV